MRTDEERLARWYRVVLLAYPRAYRRERAAEMVSTLLDGAAPGQRRPRPRDAANLVLRGLAARYAIPRGPEYLVPAVLVALFGAVLAVAGAAHLTGASEPGRPSNEVALAAALDAVGAGPAAVTNVGLSETADWFPAPGGYTHRPGSVWVEAPGPVDPGVLADVNARLAAAGWRVTAVAQADGVIVPPGSKPIRYFWASQDDLVLLVVDSRDSIVESVVDIGVHRRAAGWLSWLLVGAGLFGFAVGWRLASGALRGFRRHAMRRRSFVLALGAPGMVMATMPTMFALALAGGELLGGGHTVPLLVRIGSLVVELQPVTGVAVGLLALASVAAAGRPAPVVAVAGPATAAISGVTVPRVEPVVAWRLLARAAVVAHGVFAALPVLMVICYLVLVWRNGGHHLTGLHDPKGYIPFGFSMGNPFTWLYLAGYLGCLASPLVNPALAAVSVPLLIAGLALRLPGIRRAAVLLVCAVVASAAAELLVFSPVGRHAFAWLLD